MRSGNSVGSRFLLRRVYEHLFYFAVTDGAAFLAANKGGMQMPTRQKRKRKPKTESFQKLMELNVEAGEMDEQLTALGLKPNYGNAVRMAALRKAAAGDMTAYRLIREELSGSETGDPEDAVPPSILTAELAHLTDEELERLADGL